ncbi:MAG TPA: ATP-binding protein [Caulobacteraceae bacterium]|jgi:signal transduction histidine kinase/ActR/RegA family two-component response regulator|nr:ATP-binding protein [Caulobacteraceae bacterium]
MRLASEFRLLAPLAVTAVGAMAVFVFSLLIWSHEVDARARSREQGLVQQGVLARVTEIEGAIATQTDWDEAVAYLDNRFDAEWARSILLVELAQAAEFDDVVVLNGADAEVFPERGGDLARLGAAPLVAEVRAAEVMRGPLRASAFRNGAGPARQPIQRSAFTAGDGMVRLVTATLIQPDDGARLPGKRAAIVVTSQNVSGGLLTLMRDRFQVAPITARLGAAPDPALASVSFETSGDGPALVLSWAPQRPGADLLKRAAGPMILILLTFVCVGLVMMRKVRNAAHELLASNRAQSEFLANMSHEIRTPLNGVVAVADALRRTGLSAQQLELVQIIRSSGAILERLLSDVLDLARIETGAVAIEKEPFHLAAAVRGAAALHRLRAEEKGIGLTLNLDPAAETAVIGDQMRLKQILTNLLSNAIKFTGEGGVSLEVAPIPGSDRWRFSVEDTGVGFDPALRDRIFGRFQQADGSVTRRFGGTGLGLAICKQLAELMGGSMEAQGRPGAGACFTLVAPLPLAEGISLASDEAEAAVPQTVSAVGDPAGPSQRRLRVLVADDHPTNRRVIEVLLAGLEVELVITENGQEACEAFEAARFDAVLMDMQMPVLDGLSATRRIRAFEAREGLSPTFVAMLTANALRDHQDASMAAGADMHLSKPIEAARLFAALERAGQQAARAQAA